MIVVLVALLALAGAFAVKGLELPGAMVPDAGWIALTLGVCFSLLIGVGLITLVFYSSRKGYDEPPHLRASDNDQPNAGESSLRAALAGQFPAVIEIMPGRHWPARGEARTIPALRSSSSASGGRS